MTLHDKISVKKKKNTLCCLANYAICLYIQHRYQNIKETNQIITFFKGIFFNKSAHKIQNPSPAPAIEKSDYCSPCKYIFAGLLFSMLQQVIERLTHLRRNHHIDLPDAASAFSPHFNNIHSGKKDTTHQDCSSSHSVS